MSKEITINNAPARLSNQVHTMDCVEIPTDEEKVIIYQVIVTLKFIMKMMI